MTVSFTHQSLMKRMFPKQTGLRDTVVFEGAESKG